MEITSLRAFSDDSLPEDFADELEDPESCALWYLACKSTEAFRSERNHYPGMTMDDSYAEGIDASHVSELHAHMTKFAQSVKPDF